MRISGGIVSALDQAWLSVMNLAISFAFIRFGEKEDYGIYLLLLTPLYLFMGIQNALILSPIATVFPSSHSSEKGTVLSTAIAAQVAFVSLGALICSAGLAIYWYVAHGTIPMGLIFGFGIAIAGSCAREGVRTLFYTRGAAVGAFRSDLVYGLGLMVSVGALSYYAQLTSASALIAMGIAALWPYAFRGAQLANLQLDRQVLSKFWACGRWALVGVLVTWVNLSAYPLIVGASLSAAAVADINVARLFLMPVSLCATAWSNLHRPQISAWAAEGKLLDVKALSLKSIVIGIGMLSIFVAALGLAYPYVEILLGPSYRGLFPLVLLWSMFFVVGLPRSILMATLMTKPEGYKQLQQVSWFALVISLSGLFFLSERGTTWVVGVLVAVEIVQLALIGVKAMRFWQAKEIEYVK